MRPLWKRLAAAFAAQFLLGVLYAVPAQTLSFDEDEVGKPPKGWTAGTPAPAGFAAAVRQQGCRSRRCVVLSSERNGAGSLSRTLSAVPYRGRGIRITAWMHLDSTAPAREGRMTLRIDSGENIVLLNTMEGRAIKSSEWTQATIHGFVPSDSDTIVIGFLTSGKGSVWVDDVTLDDATTASTPILDAEAGLFEVRQALQGLYGRIDTAYESGDESLLRRIAASQAKRVTGTLEVPIAEVLSDLRRDAALGARYRSRSVVTGIAVDGTNVIVSIRQTRRREAPVNPWNLVYFNRDTWSNGPFGWQLQESKILSTRVIAPPLDAPIAAQVVEELKSKVVPVQNLAAFGESAGAARIVALGAAAVGTREMTRTRLALFKYLVEAKGFTVLALDATWPDSDLLDRYVNTGQPSAEVALSAMDLWPWYTEEAHEVVQWMRAYNQARGDRPALRVAAFDAQRSGGAATRVIDYLKRHSPEDVPAAAAAYAQAEALDRRQGGMWYSSGQAAAKAASGILTILDRKRDALVQASSLGAWRDARHAAAVVFQSCSMRMAGQSIQYRESVLASNLEWLAKEVFPDSRIAAWSSNSHVRAGRAVEEAPGMGFTLRDRFGAGYYALALTLHVGVARAIGAEENQLRVFDEQFIPAAPEGSGDAMLSAAGPPSYFLDLKGVGTTSPLGRWLSEPHLFYDFGAVWTLGDPEANLRAEALSQHYDGLIFIEDVSPSTPLAPAGK